MPKKWGGPKRKAREAGCDPVWAGETAVDADKVFGVNIWIKGVKSALESNAKSAGG